MLRSSNEESNLEADHDDLDEDENTSIIRRKSSQDEVYACDFGLRYPILQVAQKRESLRMRLKASFFYVSILSPPESTFKLVHY